MHICIVFKKKKSLKKITSNIPYHCWILISQGVSSFFIIATNQIPYCFHSNIFFFDKEKQTVSFLPSKKISKNPGENPHGQKYAKPQAFYIQKEKLCCCFLNRYHPDFISFTLFGHFWYIFLKLFSGHVASDLFQVWKAGFLKFNTCPSDSFPPYTFRKKTPNCILIMAD